MSSGKGVITVVVVVVITIVIIIIIIIIIIITSLSPSNNMDLCLGDFSEDSREFLDDGKLCMSRNYFETFLWEHQFHHNLLLLDVNWMLIGCWLDVDWMLTGCWLDVSHVCAAVKWSASYYLILVRNWGQRLWWWRCAGWRNGLRSCTRR